MVKDKPAGQSLVGRITRRILSGNIPRDAVFPGPRAQEVPTPQAVRRAKGQGLGKGATRARGGKEK